MQKENDAGGLMDKDLFKGRTCECCGKSDLLAGVAASGLGAFSILWCHLCLRMRAEPKWAIDLIFEEKNWRSQYPKDAFIYFDSDRDNYINYEGKIIHIQLKDGTKFENRTKFMEFLNANNH